ncbi:MAG: DUF2480 family protein [Flavobacteriaceae bacterium]
MLKTFEPVKQDPEPIPNRVAASKLITFDLEDHYPKGKRVFLDIKEWLHEGIVLKEKEFRNFAEFHSWDQYQDAHVALGCSSDAIVPGWAYMLVATKLQPFALTMVLGDLENLESHLYRDAIENLDLSFFQDKMVIIKGCSKKPVPSNAYLWITARLKPIAKSLMYGEACSAVPLYKKR